MTRDEFFALPVVMSFFPLSFSTGRQRWTEFKVDCNDCKRAVPVDRTRGEVSKVFGGGYRGVRVDYEVVAHALCPSCDRLTTAHYVLHADMTLTGIDAKTGKTMRWGMRRLTFLEKIAVWWKKRNPRPPHHAEESGASGATE